MGGFRVDCLVSQIVDRSSLAAVTGLLVDSGCESPWIPEAILKSIGVDRERTDLEFVMADGQGVTRDVSFAIIRVEPHFTIDEVVFGREGNTPILGARALEGLCHSIDPVEKTQVASGPLPAAPAFSC